MFGKMMFNVPYSLCGLIEPLVSHTQLPHHLNMGYLLMYIMSYTKVGDVVGLC